MTKRQSHKTSKRQSHKTSKRQSHRTSKRQSHRTSKRQSSKRQSHRTSKRRSKTRRKSSRGSNGPVAFKKRLQKAMKDVNDPEKLKMVPKDVDPESYFMDPKKFKIPKNKIPTPSKEYLDSFIPYYLIDLRSKKVDVYENKKNIKQALVKGIKDEYRYFGFTSWNNSQVGDTVFREKMANNLKREKTFDSPKEAYEYLIKKYPRRKKNFKYLLI